MHILPGRVRVKFKELQNNKGLALELQNLLNNKKNIKSVQINTLTGSCLVSFDLNIPSGDIVKIITKSLKQAIVSAKPNQQGLSHSKQQLNETKLKQVITGGTILTLFWTSLGQRNIPLPISSAALITTGYPIFKSGWNYFSEHKRPNYDFMISAISILSALMGQGYLGIFTLWLSNLSGYLQNLTFKTASNSFSNILIKKGHKVTLFKEGRLKQVLPGDILPGDLVVFGARECIPVEGEVISGKASVIPGEDLLPGEPIESGTVLDSGKIVVKVHRVVEDTSLARLADILDDAMENPAVGSDLAVSYSERLLPITFISTALVYMFTRDLKRTIPVLLAGAPGPTGLAAPSALSASTGVAAGMGIAVKDSSALKYLSNIDTVVFNDRSLSQHNGGLHPSLQRLKEEGYNVEEFDPTHIHEPAEDLQTVMTPYEMVEKIHSKGLRVAWVSGPDYPILVENADVNIMFLTGRENKLAAAPVLCYRSDPRQVYRLIRLSRDTMGTIRRNVYMVQGINMLGQLLGALGVIGSVPAVGISFLSTLVVVLNSGFSLIGIGQRAPFNASGTIQGLAVDKGKCLLLAKKDKN